MGKFSDMEIKSGSDFETLKEMLSNIYDRLGTVNNRLDVVEEAVTRNRLKNAKTALVKKINARVEKKQKKREEKHKRKEAFKELEEEFKKKKEELVY